MNGLDEIFKDYLSRFLEGNAAGKHISASLDEIGIGLGPLIDHCTIRTLDVDQRAIEFLRLGYEMDQSIGVLEFDSWWAKVYRKPGLPALFIDQAFVDARGEPSLIPQWVRTHGDNCFHHIAVLTENIENTIHALQNRGFTLAGNIVGSAGSDLRQIFTQPEIKDGEAYTVLELIERHNGYNGFLPPQADGLMESSRIPERSA